MGTISGGKDIAKLDLNKQTNCQLVHCKVTTRLLNLQALKLIKDEFF